MLSEVLRAGPEPTAGLSHLSTPDSILMSCRNAIQLASLARVPWHVSIALDIFCYASLAQYAAQFVTHWRGYGSSSVHQPQAFGQPDRTSLRQLHRGQKQWHRQSAPVVKPRLPGPQVRAQPQRAAQEGALGA